MHAGILDDQKILIIEASRVFRLVLKEILTDKFPRSRLLEARDGAEALKVVGEHDPDLAFVDIFLPDFNGLALTRMIKGGHPGIAVVLVADCDTPEYREAALECGAAGFLSKDASIVSEIEPIVEAAMASEKKFL